MKIPEKYWENDTPPDIFGLIGMTQEETCFNPWMIHTERRLFIGEFIVEGGVSDGDVSGMRSFFEKVSGIGGNIFKVYIRTEENPKDDTKTNLKEL